MSLLFVAVLEASLEDVVAVAVLDMVALSVSVVVGSSSMVAVSVSVLAASESVGVTFAVSV